MDEKQRIAEALQELRALKQSRLYSKGVPNSRKSLSKSFDNATSNSSVDFNWTRMSADAINLRSSMEVNRDTYNTRIGLLEAPDDDERENKGENNENDNNNNGNENDDSSFASTLSSVSDGSMDPDTDIILGLAIHNAEVNRVNLYEQALVLEQQRLLLGGDESKVLCDEWEGRLRSVGFSKHVERIEYDTTVDLNYAAYEMFATDQPTAFNGDAYANREGDHYDFDEGSLHGEPAEGRSSSATFSYVRKQLGSSLPGKPRASPSPGMKNKLRASSPSPLAKRLVYIPPPPAKRAFSNPTKVTAMARPPVDTFKPTTATPSLGTDFPSIEKGDVLAKHQAQIEGSFFLPLPPDTLSLRVTMSGVQTTADSGRSLEQRLMYRKSDKGGVADGLGEQRAGEEAAPRHRRLNLATMQFFDFLQKFKIDFLCLALDNNLQAMGTYDASSGSYMPGLAVAPVSTLRSPFPAYLSATDFARALQEFLNFLRVRQKSDSGRTNLLHLDLQALPESVFAVVPLVMDGASGGLSEEVCFRTEIFALREVSTASLARAATADFSSFLTYQQSLLRVTIDGYESNWSKGNSWPDLSGDLESYRLHLERKLALPADLPDLSATLAPLWSRLGEQTFGRSAHRSVVPFVVFRLKGSGARHWALRTFGGSDMQGSSLRAVYEPLLGLLRSHNVLPYKLVHVEHCENCEAHQLTTRHVPGSYEKAFVELIKEFSRRLPPVVLYSNLPGRQKEPRMGAFEVQLERFEDSSATLVFSKIRRRRFPVIDELLDELSAIVLPKVEFFDPTASPELSIRLQSAYSKEPTGRALVTVYRVDSSSASAAGAEQCAPCGPAMESQAFARVRTWGRAEVVRWLRAFGATEFAVTNIINAGVVDGAALLRMVNRNSLRAWGVNNLLVLQRLLLDLEGIKAGLPDDALGDSPLRISGRLVSAKGSGAAEQGNYEVVTESYCDDQGSLSVRIERSGTYCFRVVSESDQEYCSRFVSVPSGAGALRMQYTALLHPRLVLVTFTVSVKGRAGLVGRQDAGALISLVHLASCRYHYVLFRECHNNMRSQGEGKVFYELQQWLPEGAYLSLVDGRVLHVRCGEPLAVTYGDAAVRKCNRRSQRRCVKLFKRAFGRHNQSEKAKAMFALLLIRIKLKRKLLRIRENIKVRKVVRLQSFLRRCSLQSLYTAKQRAAIRIQSQMRRWRAVRIVERIRNDPHAGSKTRTVFSLMRSLGFQTVKAKVMVIGNFLLRRVNQRRREKAEASVKIQRFARKSLRMKKEHKKELIKSNLRGLRSFSRLMIKNVHNKKDARRVAAQMAEAEQLRLESKRNEKARLEQQQRQLKEERAAARTNGAAAKIQRLTRQFFARTRYQRMRSGVLKIQRRFRLFSHRRLHQPPTSYASDAALDSEGGKWVRVRKVSRPATGGWVALSTLLGRVRTTPVDIERSRVLLQSIARMWPHRCVYVLGRKAAGALPLPLRRCRALKVRPSASQELARRALPLARALLLNGRASLQSLVQSSGVLLAQQTLTKNLHPRQLAVGVRGLRLYLRVGGACALGEDDAAQCIQAQWRGAHQRLLTYQRLPELARCMRRYHNANDWSTTLPVDRPRFRPAGLVVSTVSTAPLVLAKESLRFLTSTAPGTPLAKLREGIRDNVTPAAIAGLTAGKELLQRTGAITGSLVQEGAMRLHEGLSRAREAAEEYVALQAEVSDRGARRESGVIAIHDGLLHVSGVNKKSLPQRPVEWYVTVMCQPLGGGARREKAEITSSLRAPDFSPQRVGELSIHAHLTDLHRYDEVVITLHMQAGDGASRSDEDEEAGGGEARSKRFVAAFACSVFLSRGMVFGPTGGRALARLLPQPTLVFVPGNKKLLDAKSIDVFVTLMPVAVPSSAYLSTLQPPEQARSLHPWHLIDAEHLEPARIQWDAISGSAVCSAVWRERIFVSLRSKASSMGLVEFDLSGKFIGELGELSDSQDIVLIIVSAQHHVAFCSNRGRLTVLSDAPSRRPLHLQGHPNVHVTAAASLTHAGLDFFFTADKANNICVTIVEHGECERCCLNPSFLQTKIVSMMAFREVLYLCLEDGTVSLVSLRDILGGSLGACSSLAGQVIVQYPVFRGAGIASSALLPCDEHLPQPGDVERPQLKYAASTYQKRSPKGREAQDDIRVHQGPTLFFGGDDADPVVKVYHGLQGNKLIPVALLEGHSKEITSLVLDSGGRYLFSGSSAEKKIRVWDLLSFTLEIEFTDVSFVALAGGPDALLAISFRGPYLRLWRSSKRPVAPPQLLFEDLIASIRHPRWAYAVLKKVLPAHRVGQRSLMKLPNSLGEYGEDPRRIVAMWKSIFNKGLPIVLHARPVARAEAEPAIESRLAEVAEAEDNTAASSQKKMRQRKYLHFSDSEEEEEEENKGRDRRKTKFPKIKERPKVSIQVFKYDDVE